MGAQSSKPAQKPGNSADDQDRSDQGQPDQRRSDQKQQQDGGEQADHQHRQCKAKRADPRHKDPLRAAAIAGAMGMGRPAIAAGGAAATVGWKNLRLDTGPLRLV